MDEMFNGLMKEIFDQKPVANMKDSVGKTAKSQAVKMANAISNLNEVCNDLKDEVKDKEVKISELEAKVGEYNEIIQWMEMQYEEAEEEYDSIIQYIDTYYEEKVEKMSPRFVRKRWVANKTKGMSF